MNRITSAKSGGCQLKPGDQRSAQKALPSIAKIPSEKEIPKCVLGLFIPLPLAVMLSHSQRYLSGYFFLMGQTPFLVPKQGNVGDVHTSVPAPETIPVGVWGGREPAACPCLFPAVLCFHRPWFSYRKSHKNALH